MTLRSVVLTAALLLAACGGADAPKPVAEGPDAVTPRNPFFGTWELTAAKVAPWWQEAAASPPEADQALTKFVFEADESKGAPILACDKPRYAVNIVPERGLFGGKLNNPTVDAANLGFAAGDVTSMTFDCPSGETSETLAFPMVNDDTIMLGHGDVLYTFKRTG